MPSATATAAADPLAGSAQFLRGVGPDRFEKLKRLGLTTVEDLLYYFPERYEDLRDRRRIVELQEGSIQTVRARVLEIDSRQLSDNRSLVGILLTDGTGFLRAKWFNAPYTAERFRREMELIVSGKPKFYGGGWQMINPRTRPAEPAAEENSDRASPAILPVYRLTHDLRQHEIRRAILAAVTEHAADVADIFPEPFRRTHRLTDVAAALAAIHNPDSDKSLAAARRRLVYEEFFLLELALAASRHVTKDTRQAPRFVLTEKIDARIRRLFPFQLTKGQNAAIRDLVRDLASGRPMTRLLQGDVGSGKTAVAVYALLLTVAHKHQAALMAPTEILARQHWRTLDRYLRASRVRRLLLTGGLTATQRRTALGDIREGRIDLVVGTQAIIQKDVEFHQLGLVVIDEQHKFGVRQRASFRKLGLDPHYLVMTATPIPRTISLTLYGDLDVSTIRDQPPGRQRVRTYLATPDDRPRAFDFLRKKLREGRQAYVVCPLVEQSETIDLKSAEETYEELRVGPFADFRTALVHGKMSEDEKEAVMARFRSRQVDLLVTTLVIEAGVDIPNATLIFIEHAERFGLSQLHQLRGRVARGSYPGYCFLAADARRDDSRPRLDAMLETTDGFKIAEIDLRLRGPGELLGTRQHGLLDLRIGDLAADADLLTEARKEAFATIDSDDGLRRPEHAAMRDTLLRRYGSTLDLAGVG